MNLGKRIKNVRETKGLRQEDVFTGIVSNSHYSNIESGRYNASQETINLIARRLDVPKYYFTSIGINCDETQSLLEKYEVLVLTGDTEKTSSFLVNNKDKLEYIPSINQEAYYRLLIFLHLINSNKYKDALAIFEKYLKEVDQFTLDDKQKSIYLYATGIYYYMINSHKNSIIFFKELLKIIDDSSILKPKVLYNIAMSLYNIYIFSESIEYVEESKIYYLKLHEWEKVGDCYNLLIVLYRELKNYSKAETYLEKGFMLCRNNTFELKAKLHHNHSLICYDQERYKEALDSINKSIEIKNKKSIPGMFVSYKLKLSILLHMNDISMFNKTLITASKFINTKLHEAQYLFIEAKKHFILGELDLYELKINKAIIILKSQESWKELRTVAENYSLFLEGNRRYKKAFELERCCNLALKNMYEEES